MSGRLMPWLLLAAAIAIGLYYFYGQTPEVTVTAPREKPVPSLEGPRQMPPEPVSPSGDALGHEISPEEATARDAAAAMRQLEREQQKEIGKPSLYPDEMDKDLRKPPPGNAADREKRH